MKRSVKLLILVMFGISLCSCQSIPASDVQASASPESASDSSAPDSLNPQDDNSIYQFHKPLVENDGLLEIAPLDLPSEINGRKLAPSNILSETQLLVLLYEEYTVPVVQEVGIYDLTSGEYSVSFAVEEGKSISIEWASDDLVVYKETDASGNAVSLRYWKLDTGDNLLVYQFSQGYCDTSASRNQVVSDNGKIYFDDIVTREGKLVGVNLLEYDLETQQVTIFKENAQNPMVLDSGLAYITRDEATGTFCVESARTEEKIPLDQRISALASASDELYSINNRSTDPETGRTIWSLDSLVAEEELLLSSNVIDGPAANRSVVTWRNFTPERPILYLREEDCFTVFLEDEIAYNTYLLGDDWGILICSHDDAPTTYYRFSRAAEK